MTIQERYDELTKDARPNRNVVYAYNERMSRDSEKPVLIEVPVQQWKSRSKAYQKQGYTLFTPAPKVAAPVEAKKAPKAETIS